MASRASAVVVNYNAGRLLLDCVASLRASGVDDVVVADNGSVDRSDAQLQVADPDARLHSTGANLGYGTGANRGVALVDGEADFVLVCNADVLLQGSALDALVGALEAEPAAALVGPQIDDPDGSRYPSPRRFPSLVDGVGHALLGLVWPTNPFTERYRMEGSSPTTRRVVDWVSGSCFLVRRSAWDEIGGFDESYFMYAEDVDLCWRLGRAGWRVLFEPTARVVHVQGASTDLHPYRMIVHHHRSLLRFATRTSRGAERLLLPVMALGLLARIPAAWLHRRLRGRRRLRATPR